MQIDILLQKIAKPAQRALLRLGVTTMEELSKFSEKEIGELHGIGKNAVNVIKQMLSDNGLSFSNKDR